jgi:hypothetical protein
MWAVDAIEKAYPLAKDIHAAVTGARAKEQRRALWKFLSERSPTQIVTTSDLYSAFGWLVEKPLFRDEQEVEDVLRSMYDEGVRFDPFTKGWRLERPSSGR